MNNNIRVSFDFDSTLSRTDVQVFAQHLCQLGFEVWIVTSRYNNQELLKKWPWITEQNQKLFKVAESCGIPKERIHFTNMESKSIFLKGRGFKFHLDDDEVELMDILESKDPCRAVNVDHFEWLQTCESILGI